MVLFLCSNVFLHTMASFNNIINKLFKFKWQWQIVSDFLIAILDFKLVKWLSRQILYLVETGDVLVVAQTTFVNKKKVATALGIILTILISLNWKF